MNKQFLDLINKYDLTGIGFSRKVTNDIQSKNPCVTFSVKSKKPTTELNEQEIIPTSIEINGIEYITDVIEQQQIELVACGSNNDNYQNFFPVEMDWQRTSHRPLVGGLSIANFWDSFMYTGTMGQLCIDQRDGSVVGLTNAHVSNATQMIVTDPLDNTMTQPKFYTTYNKDIVQPSPSDAQRYYDNVPKRQEYLSQSGIGVVKRYWPVISSGNTIDAALISIKNDNTLVDNTDANTRSRAFSIKHIGETLIPWATPAQMAQLETDFMAGSSIYVTKSGRSTGITGSGYQAGSCPVTIQSINYAFPLPLNNLSERIVAYEDTFRFRYTDTATYAHAPLDGGDSGSVLVTDYFDSTNGGSGTVIGLNFAGNGYNLDAISCKITNVASILNVRGATLTDTSSSLKFGNPQNWNYIAAEHSDKIFQSTNVDLATSGYIMVSGKKYWQIGNIPKP